jgi:homoserine kinase
LQTQLGSSGIAERIALNTSSPTRVLLPASTSNLGPGFDFLGLALSLHLEATCTGPSASGSHELARLEGTAEAWPRDGENLLLRAFDLAASRLGLEHRGLRFEVRSEIPIARGLGSSGAAVAAGLRLASAIAPRKPSIDELLLWGLEIEGHPDNVCAALLGGCTLSVPVPGHGLKIVRQDVHRDLAFALAWPSRGLATTTARKALPALVPFADAVENPRRLALLLEGLRTADPELLARGGEDRLHVPYRLRLIPGGAAAIEAARKSGASLATISGSGSGLIAIGPRDRVESIAAAMVSAFRAVDAGGEGAGGRVAELVKPGPDYPRAKP